MKLDAGVTVLPSAAGVIFTCLLVVVMLGYTVQKTYILVHRRDVDMMTVTKTNFFDQNFVFNHEQGLNFAVALSGVDNEKEDILDRSIGSIVFQAITWSDVDSERSYILKKENVMFCLLPNIPNITYIS